MDHDDDREHRRRAARETATLLHDHRERLDPPRGAAEASWAALRARIAAGEVGPLADEDDAAVPGVRRRMVPVIAAALAVAAGVALWRFVPDAAQGREGRGGLAAIFQQVDPDGSRRAAARTPVTSERRTAPVPGDIAPEPGPVPGEPPVSRDRPGGELARELLKIRAASEALRDGRGEDALAAVDQYLRSHPTGTFVPEARLHRSEALCLLGRRDDARAAAAAFLRELPDSPLSARVSSVCAEK